METRCRCRLVATVLRSVFFAILFCILYVMYVDMEKLKEDVGQIDKNCSDLPKLHIKDSVGRPDYALHSSGGRIISVDAESYSNLKTFLGFNLCEGEQGPSSMIKSSTAPGECWAFSGKRAKAVIQLIDDVLVDAITVEHVPPTISPGGKIDAAPKEFQIWGLSDPKGTARKLLGQFTYESTGGAVQYFNINNKSYYSFVEFQVLNNHGNQNFTCVYGVRIHGTPKNL